MEFTEIDGGRGQWHRPDLPQVSFSSFAVSQAQDCPVYGPFTVQLTQEETQKIVLTTFIDHLTWLPARTETPKLKQLCNKTTL